MKSIINYIFILFAANSYGQTDTILITSQENLPLKALVSSGYNSILYAGQEYTFNIITSSTADLRVQVENAKIHLIERSKMTTGAFDYSVTPIDTGECSILVGNVFDDQSSVGLLRFNYRVIDYPVPPINLKGFHSRRILTKLKDSTIIECSYSSQTGIYDKYEIKSWSAKVGEKIFSGKGEVLSHELIEYINDAENIYLHLTVVLYENKTGHLSSDEIYLISIKDEH